MIKILKVTATLFLVIFLAQQNCLAMKSMNSREGDAEQKTLRKKVSPESDFQFVYKDGKVVIQKEVPKIIKEKDRKEENGDYIILHEE